MSIHKEILTEKQIAILPLIKSFRDDFYLAGGTAVALQIGHRRSIDFDLFSKGELDTLKITNTIIREGWTIDATMEESRDELTLVIKGVKVTFLHYPFPLDTPVDFDGYVVMPDLLTLGAMKAYSLGRRGKWKDYVDLYFLLRDHLSLEKISKRAREVFAGGFNERLFREQLCYFEDIDFSEDIDYLGEQVDEEEIKRFLTDIAVRY